MAVTKQDLIDWMQKNEETLIGQLVLYHSHVDLAYVVLHPEKLDDNFIERIKLRLEKSEGLLDVEKQKRKKVAAAAKKQVVQETDEEAEERLKAEKATATEKAGETKSEEKWDDFSLPDDDWAPDPDDLTEEMEDVPF